MITFHNVSKRYGERLALDSVSWRMDEGDCVVILGHSGAGKTTILKLITHEAQPTSGGVIVGTFRSGRLSRAQRALLRRTLGIIYEDFRLLTDRTVFENVALAVRISGVFRNDEVIPRVLYALEEVGLQHKQTSLPGELSAGEKQRAAIARALAGDPDVIVADEPVSALDVSVQAAIINLLNEIQAARGATLVFISHDLAVVRYLADTVAVMYLGTIAEFGPVERVFAPPYHPYTEALLSAVPVPDPDHAVARILLEGPVPRADEVERGCPFATRCPRRLGAICDDTPPPVQQLAADHRIACHIGGEELRRLQTSLVEPSAAGR